MVLSLRSLLLYYQIAKKVHYKVIDRSQYNIVMLKYVYKINEIAYN